MKLDGYQAADALRAKELKLSEVIEGSDLGKKFGKIPEAVTPEFRALLLEAKEETWPARIADRVKVLTAAGAGTQQPRSSGKGTTVTESRENGVPADAHVRLAAALR